MTVTVFVEGGGARNKALATQCRRGFAAFIQKAGFQNRMPHFVVCGGRANAFDRFKTAFTARTNNEFVMLLVDSEGPVNHPSSWTHVENRVEDGWRAPANASDDHLHLMVQAMEAWFLADRDALASYFGQGFNANALSQQTNIELIPKNTLKQRLRQASKNTAKGAYTEGKHSFEILAEINPEKVRRASPNHAERFFRVLDCVC